LVIRNLTRSNAASAKYFCARFSMTPNRILSIPASSLNLNQSDSYPTSGGRKEAICTGYSAPDRPVHSETATDPRDAFGEPAHFECPITRSLTAIAPGGQQRLHWSFRAADVARGL
jgi:hypothetical protein